MANDEPAESCTWEKLSKAEFEIGGEDHLAGLRREFPTTPTDREDQKRLDKSWKELARQAGIKVGTLLKSDNVSFLIAAGASKCCGGVLLSSVPKEIERQILTAGAEGQEVKQWLKLFYEAVRRVGGTEINAPVTSEWVLHRLQQFATSEPLKVNFEKVLSCLFRWHAVLHDGTEKMQLGGPPSLEIESGDLKTALSEAKKNLLSRCELPAGEGGSESLKTHKEFLKKLLTRPLNLKRADIFTLNYDTLIEKAADAEGIVLIDGFVGAIQRVFRPESFDQDLYFPAETTEGRVHRLERVIHLYKLHGSVNWLSQEPDWNNPYGVTACQAGEHPTESILIYPTPSKYGDILGMPYTELFRRFAASVVRRQSTLFVIGYGFGDEHVNAIIRQALAIPSFSLVIIDPFAPSPSEAGSFVGSLRAQQDRRIWIISGESLGSFSRFVEELLPDLRDEEILGKVMRTYRALGGEPQGSAGEGDHAE